MRCLTHVIRPLFVGGLFTTLMMFVDCVSARAVAESSTDLNHQFLRVAPELLQNLRAAGYHNVGVLKFRVQKGNQPLDRVGTLNLDLAERLELSLILKDKSQKTLDIIRDASSAAAQTPGADHRTAEGRKKLFDVQYSLLGGKQVVRADALLIGTAKIDDTLGKISVSIFVYDRNGAKKLCEFQATPTLAELSESGESFVLRGIFDQGSVQLSDSDRTERAQAEVVEQVALIKESHSPTLPKQHPLSVANPDAPVALEVYYGNRPVRYEFRDGCAIIPEPAEQQRVKFVLSRKVRDNHRYAIVLKVNGENSIARQRLLDIECQKWVLDPGDPPITIPGFQMDNAKAERFTVLSPSESKLHEIDYGRDVGTISMVVYRERDEKEQGPSTTIDEDYAILTRRVFPSPPVTTNVTAVSQSGELQVRGIFVAGETIQNQTKHVTFEADPLPVMSSVITYYHNSRP